VAEASARAEQIVADAELAAVLRDERADRRLNEAESAARDVREHVAQEMGRSQRELYELRKAAKAEAMQTVVGARAEADALRTTARKLLADARTELADLTQRRDAIAAELGNLSGVIYALSVPEVAVDARADDAVQGEALQGEAVQGEAVQGEAVQGEGDATAGGADEAAQQAEAAASDPLEHEPRNVQHDLSNFYEMMRAE
jgi:hypothetical protein